MKIIFLILLSLTAVFMILLVLIQRGRGGGLAGAFGGMGGQSAFGAKAGDTFTRITIGVAGFWIVLCVLALGYFRWGQRSRLDIGGSVPAQGPALLPTQDENGSAAGSAPAGTSGAETPAGTPAPSGGNGSGGTP
ncbi:MAG: preprotein translocase subunit SecG [Thermogutta sp.]|nr:preprotein translocase subunit SecG [Thermogutta sp.]